MKGPKFNREYLSLEKARVRYEGLCEELTEKIKPYVDFPAIVSWNEGDRHMLLNEDRANVAPLDWCLDWIEKNGFLPEEEHENLSI